MIRRLLFGLALTGFASAWAGESVKEPAVLSDQLVRIRKKIDSLEQDWLNHLKSQKNARSEIKKAQQLIQLKRREKDLVDKRIHEVEKTLAGLDSRKSQLGQKIQGQQFRVMKLMKALDISYRQLNLAPVNSADVSLSSLEKGEAPRRKVMAHLVDHGLKEIEVLRIDLSDLEQLEGQIQDERQQIAYFSQELQEQESVLALNRQLQMELLKKEKGQSLTQLENYRKLKNSESQVEHLISEFNTRSELEDVVDSEKRIAKLMKDGGFSKARGKLPFPVEGGRVVSVFGKGFDRLSGLQIFKKGVEISAQKSQPVMAISAGRVAFSGELPNYGQVMIIDHGDHFYSLVGHLGSALKKQKDWVSAGDSIGQTDPSGTPIYFEIRSRNVAVNPLQWVLN